MKKINLFLLCLAGIFTLSLINAQTGHPRQIIPVDSAWRFWQGDDPAAKQPDFNDAGWRILNLPHD